MEISLDAGAIVLTMWSGIVGIGFTVKSLQADLRKTAQQLDRLIIAAEKAQAREEAKAQFALEAMNRKTEG